MPDDLEITQNTPTPDSPQNSDSAPSDTPNLAQNASTEGFTPIAVESQNQPVNTIASNPENGGFSAGEAESEPVPEPVQATEPSTAQMTGNEPFVSRNKIRELLAKAQFAIQFRKRKKLDKIMSLFLEKSKITNDEVEKLLHVSDATATRYLSQLEKEGKVQQNSKTGKGVSYSRI